MKSSSRREAYDFGRRLILGKLVVCFAMSILVVRVWYLQILHGGYYRDMSENNRSRTIRTAAPRGAVFDREGRVLVRNRSAFNIALMLEDTPNVEQTLSELALISGRPLDDLKAQFRSGRKSRPFEPRVVLADVSREELARVKVNGHRLPGVIITTTPARIYPNGNLAAQLFGYAREITREQLNQTDTSYRPGDLIGQAGLEAKYEPFLRGRAGYVQVEVDAQGNRRGELGILDEVVGNDLHLTIDLDLQRAAELGLGDKRGAVVVLDPRDGSVLALASTPSFDANIFSGQMLASEWKTVAHDPAKPMISRALANVYPPGSTIKLVWALAGLAEGVIGPNTHLFCPGYYQLGRRKYRCHKKEGHGSIDLKTAIAVSCNAYFFQLGQMLGIQGMNRYLNMFGYGEPTGVDLPREEKGISPGPEWKQRVLGERWYPGDTLPVSIGQGYMVATPMQMALAASVLANNGKVYQPRVVSKIVHQPSGEEERFSPQLRRALEIKPEHFALVRQFASEVVNHKRGTGWRAKLESVNVGGKTGTAQVRAGLYGENAAEKWRDHAWFVGFAPIEKPELAWAIIVENVGHGGTFAVPIAREILKTHFRKQGVLSDADWQDLPVKQLLAQSASSATVNAGREDSARARPAARVSQAVEPESGAQESGSLEEGVDGLEVEEEHGE